MALRIKGIRCFGVRMNHARGSDLETIPFSKSFSGHETFAFRYSWLKKGVDLLMVDPAVFHSPDACVRFGVGKNMVASIRHWCLAARVAEQDSQKCSRLLRPTELGSALLRDDGWDPFLEDDATLWLIHWNLASAGTRAATWYWAFNQFQEYSFVKADMAESLARDMQSTGWSTLSLSTLRRDVDCFVQTYLPRNLERPGVDDAIECPLANLNMLIREPDSERLRFRVGPKRTLPPAVFAYALIQFWNLSQYRNDTLALRDVLLSQGSPGLIFKLDQETTLDYLDTLKEITSGLVIFEDTPLVRRLVKVGDVPRDPTFLLENYYGTR